MDAVTINDGVWEELVQATNGAVNLCFQCGTCSAICPWSLLKEDYNIRKIIRDAQCNSGTSSRVWDCTTCAQCEVTCPHGVDITKVVRVVRGRAFRERKAPKEFGSLFWAMFWDGNPYRLPPSKRMAWTRGERLPDHDGTKDFLLYFGDEYCYEQRAMKVARSLVRVLNKAGVNYGTLGGDESTLGSPVSESGYGPFFDDIMNENAKKFAGKGVKEVVSLSPHDFHVLKNEYPRAGGTFGARHILQVVKDLLDGGKLKFTNEVRETVAYHDPCYLGRRNAVFDAPRDILNAIPGLKLAEFPNNRYDALCCGGGGGRMWLDTPAEERFSNLRMKEAAGTDATVVATSCPYCIINFEDSAKFLKMKGVKVMDVLELVNTALGG